MTKRVSAITFRTLIALALIACSVVSPPQPAIASSPTVRQCSTAEARTDFGKTFPQDLKVRAGSVKRVAPPNGAPAYSLRLHLHVDGTVSKGTQVVFRDENYSFLASAGPLDFTTNQDGASLWTGSMVAKSVLVEYVSDNPSSTLAVDSLIASPEQTEAARVFSSRTSTPTWPFVEDSDNVPAKMLSDKVGFLVGTSIEGTDAKNWCCTAVLVAPDVALTNWHCGPVSDEGRRWENSDCSAILIDFGWLKSAERIRRQYSCSEILAANEQLDFAFLAIKPVIGSGAAVGQPAFVKPGKPPAAASKIFVIHHAMCNFKRISNCSVDGAQYPGWTTPLPLGSLSLTQKNFTEFTHFCPTEAGSSGAPVFDDTGKLVGLHHAGFNVDPSCPDDRLNKAIRIDAILNSLSTEHAELLQRLGWTQ